MAALRFAHAVAIKLHMVIGPPCFGLQIMPPGAVNKAKKGKKQDTIKSDLTHILGYTGTDLDALGPPSPVGSEKETAAAGQILYTHNECLCYKEMSFN